MRKLILNLTFAAASVVCLPAHAEEVCYERSGQFGTMRHCVTSAHAPDGDTNFGPQHLAATDDGAWCANAERNQMITLHLKPRALLRTVTLTNGYAKSAEAFRQNGRVKRALIETDTGYRGTISPKDTTAPQKFIIPKGRYTWVRLAILETHRGVANPNVCLSEFLVNLEELGNS